MNTQELTIAAGVVIALVIAGGSIFHWFTQRKPASAPTSPSVAEAIAATATAAKSVDASPLSESQAFAALQRLKDFLKMRGVPKETRDQLLHPILPHLFADNDPPNPPSTPNPPAA